MQEIEQRVSDVHKALTNVIESLVPCAARLALREAKQRVSEALKYLDAVREVEHDTANS